MLILTRKCGSFIRIGPEIVVRVIRTGRSTVKLGIEAPADVRVVRGELNELPDRFEHDLEPEDAVLLQH